VIELVRIVSTQRAHLEQLGCIEIQEDVGYFLNERQEFSYFKRYAGLLDRQRLVGAKVTVVWPDLTLPPINLWTAPALSDKQRLGLDDQERFAADQD
jgi:hypothetical protein